MRKLETIQTKEKLNDIYAGNIGTGNASHRYIIVKANTLNIDVGRITVDADNYITAIDFQNGTREDSNSISGVLDCDLLEIVYDRLRGFQSGEFACEENAEAMYYIDKALSCMNKRIEDRIKRNVLGTMNK